MTGQYLYTIGQQRIADFHREAERERLAASVPSRSIGNGRLIRFTRLRRRTPPAQVTTT
jgi:hypothetical protein